MNFCVRSIQNVVVGTFDMVMSRFLSLKIMDTSLPTYIIVIDQNDEIGLLYV